MVYSLTKFDWIKKIYNNRKTKLKYDNKYSNIKPELKICCFFFS